MKVMGLEAIARIDRFVQERIVISIISTASCCSSLTSAADWTEEKIISYDTPRSDSERPETCHVTHARSGHVDERVVVDLDPAPAGVTAVVAYGSRYSTPSRCAASKNVSVYLPARNCPVAAASADAFRDRGSTLDI
jgi:hypothetical protein